MGGYDPYSASKGAAELLIAAYRRSFFSPDRLAQHGVRLGSARPATSSAAGLGEEPDCDRHGPESE